MANQRESHRPMAAMMRVRLKADGRIVEILADGSERAIASQVASAHSEAPSANGAVAATATNSGPADWISRALSADVYCSP